MRKLLNWLRRSRPIAVAVRVDDPAPRPWAELFAEYRSNPAAWHAARKERNNG